MAKLIVVKPTRGRANALPPLSSIAFRSTHRLLPSKYSPNEESVLTRLTSDTSVLSDLFETESRTNDRLEAELGLLPGISQQELVANVPYASVINAAFTHARPDGARFNGPHRGAWYAAKTIQAAQHEVAYHQSIALEEVGLFKDEMTYDEYLADFTGEFHDITTSKKFSKALNPNSYKESQALAETLLEAGSLGIVYPSVRMMKGVCIVCFRPALVNNVRKGRTFAFRWSGTPVPVISEVKNRRN